MKKSKHNTCQEFEEFYKLASMNKKLVNLWKNLEGRFMPPYAPGGDPLLLWRERILFVLFLVTSVLGPIALIPSLILSFYVKRYDIALLDILAYGTAVYLLFSGKKVSLIKRAWMAFAVFYLLGNGLLFMLGFHGAGYIWLFGASVLIGGIGGMRMAIWTLLLNVLSLVGVGFYIAFGSPGWAESLNNALNVWIVMTVNFMLISAMITITATVMLEGLKSAFDRERRVSTDLRVSQEKYKSLIETLPYGVVEIGMDGKISFVNRACQKIMGYSPEETTGAYVWDGRPLHEEQEALKQEFFQVVERLPRPKPWKGQFLSKYGKLRDLQVVWDYNYDQSGQLEGFLTVITDITEKVEAEKIRKSMEEGLKHSQRMESIGTLAGGIAHDFNNILNSIIGFTELSLDDAIPASLQEECLREVLQAGSRATGLVRQILTFARKGSEDPRPVRVSSITKEALQLLRSTLPAAIKIKQRINSESLVMADPTQIHQVLLNLCTNAAQSMEEKGGVLQVDLTDVVVDANFATTAPGIQPGDYMKIVVSDTGYGIPSDIIPSIFEPYFTTKGLGEGTGLGLAVVHGIVQSCGGDILVKSEIGKGAEFSVYLPLVRGKAEAIVEREPEPMPLGQERILFVDDEPSIVKLGSKMLERLGYTVTTQTSSVEALNYARKKPQSFDMVITDMSMPDMNGDILATEIMKIRPGVPVILCTGYSSKITQEKAEAIGIRAFAMKPLRKAELARSIRQVLDKPSAKAPG
ncbi:MAG: response regulator [Desulfatibacillum sp.]|nr:response regulator [Desulfatibacillum sp.]